MFAMRTDPEHLRHGGIVLAAGASSRMGRPKALLAGPDGPPLAAGQAARLQEGGCADIVIVLGGDFPLVQPALSGWRLAHNRDWRYGRLSSVQCGIAALPHVSGYLILPVDTVGVKTATIRQTLRFAEARDATAVRPTHGGRRGKLAWISKTLATELLRVKVRNDQPRLDHLLAGRAEELEVDDPAILSNVNTPEDWRRTSQGE